MIATVLTIWDWAFIVIAGGFVLLWGVLWLLQHSISGVRKIWRRLTKAVEHLAWSDWLAIGMVLLTVGLIIAGAIYAIRLT